MARKVGGTSDTPYKNIGLSNHNIFKNFLYITTYFLNYIKLHDG